MNDEEKRSALQLFQKQLNIRARLAPKRVNISLNYWPKDSADVERVCVRFKGMDIITGKPIDKSVQCYVYPMMDSAGKWVDFNYFGKFEMDPYLCFSDGSERQLESPSFYTEIHNAPEAKPKCWLVMKETRIGLKLQITGQCKSYAASNLWFKYNEKYFKIPKALRNGGSFSMLIPGATRTDVKVVKKMISSDIDFVVE